MNWYLAAATVLLVLVVPPASVCVRGRAIDGVIALEAIAPTLTLTLLCLAEGFARSVYFGVAIVAAGASWIGSLVFVRFLGERL